MYTDDEYLSLLQDKIDNSFFKTRSCLVVDDQYVYDILSSSDRLRCCPICHNPIKHSVSSVCAGHGDFPRYVTFSCYDGCGYSYKSCISYGRTYLDVVSDYVSSCSKIVDFFKK